MFLDSFPPSDWLLEYERSGFTRTGRYAEAVAFCQRLDRESEDARMIRFGKSPEGREMVALLISADGKFDDKSWRQSKKPLVFILNGIHPGEIDGKDASLILARRILIEKQERKLLQGANILIVPVFSVDGHERFSPFNRINQNGPAEMGWRATGQNLNLNRDFMKADGGEMQNLLKLLHRYKPDFFFDNHVTNGGDWQYVMGLGVTDDPSQDPGIARWTRSMYESVRVKNDAAGFLTSKYFSLNDQGDPTKGIRVGAFSPRFSTGYLSALNRPAMLVETHVLKPYKQRVDATYANLKHTIEHVIDTSRELKSLIKAADATRPEEVVLTSTRGEPRPFTFKGFPFTPYTSDLTGGRIPKWDRSQPTDYPSSIIEDDQPGMKVAPPAAYLLSQAWRDVATRLALHGIKVERLSKDLELEVATHRLGEVRFPTAPFEARFQPSFVATPIREKRTYRKGDLLIRSDQPLLKLIVHLMDADAPDSFLRWGFFNGIFEQKEYGENYAVEPMAKRLAAENPALKAEFDEFKKSNPSPAAQLNWWYERSPYFDARLRKNPVASIDAATLAKL